MEDVNQKRCAECVSLINFNAKSCPFCAAPQIKGTKRSQRLAFAVFLSIPCVMMLVIMRITGGHRNRFPDYAQQVRVVSSELRFETDAKGGKSVAVVGTIRNNSPLSWNDPKIEVQIFNAEGKLTDAKTEYEPNQTLAAHTEQAFKVTMASIPKKPNSVSHKVFVRYAEDENRYKFW